MVNSSFLHFLRWIFMFRVGMRLEREVGEKMGNENSIFWFPSKIKNFFTMVFFLIVDLT